MYIKVKLLLQKGFHSIDRWFMNECEKHQLFLYCAKNFDDELVLEKQDLDFNLSFTSRNLQNTKYKMHWWVFCSTHYVSWSSLLLTLVTQPMSQLQPNPTELRSMDYYHQIFCRFWKCKQKVPPPSPLSIQKLPFTPPKDEKNLPLGG